MTTFYFYDEKSIYSGVSIEQADTLPVPKNSTFIEPPALSGSEVARWLGGSWEVLSEVPSENEEDILNSKNLEIIKSEKEQAALSKLTGIEILEVMCSATEEDQNGLVAMAMGVTISRQHSSTFPDTRFKFSNGNSLIITDENFNELYAKWTTFRQSFFAVD